MRWAYQAYEPATAERRHPARWEVGQGLYDALKATVPPRDDDEGDEGGPRLPHATLLGIPLTVNEELGPFGWRTLAWDGSVIAAGTEG